MDVHLNEEAQAKLNKLALDTGRPLHELVEDAIAGYSDELLKTQGMLNARYDDLKSGRVRLIDGKEALAQLKAKTEAQRRRSA
ncbi:MAG: ribbon-helix-helix protein, CopG family [Bryobacteraceae bacterium]